MGRWRARRAVALAIVMAALLAGVVTPSVAYPATPTQHPSSRPNILFVLTDDMAAPDLASMPRTRELIGAHGATFDRYFVSDPACCPSRATTLRGQYAHNTGVKSNGGSNGGFPTAFARGIEHRTIATLLQGRGYQTGLFGKYLNKYPLTAGDRYVPPGWNDWASPVLGHPYSQYRYTLNVNTELHTFGGIPADYGTDVYVGMARQFIERAVSDGQPFFAYLSVYAPHHPATPAVRDLGRFRNARAPRTPAFDLADVEHMPSYVRRLHPLSQKLIAQIDELERRRLESLQAVDRGVAELVETLRRLGQLSNTYIVFTSDNGFHLGERRMPAGKDTPYDTDVLVPLLVRGPNIAPGTQVTEISGNTDLAPTFAAMAGAQPLQFTDGRSLLGLLHGNDAAPAAWRTSYLLEHWPTEGKTRSGVASKPVPGHLLLDRHVVGKIPQWSALRTQRYLYVEYADGDRELYDLTHDPDEIDNLAGTKPSLERRLAARLHGLRGCQAAQCRTADSEGPP